MRLFFLCAGAALAMSASGCKIFDGTCDPDDRGCLANPLFARGLGGSCTRLADCKNGLFCDDGTCQPRGDTPRDEPCRLTAECGSNDYCGSRRVCSLAGDGDDRTDCKTTSSCQHGLVCESPDLSQLGTLNLAALAEVSGLCTEAGDNEQGQQCEKISDCLAGLACVPCNSPNLECRGNLEPGDKICVSLAPLDFELPAIPQLWDGVTCPEVAEDDPKVAYFDVPRSNEEPAPASFYSLPFPNDARLEPDGHINLDGHPVPPDSFNLPFVARYVDIAAQDLTGFSTNPVVLFRFSHPYNFNTVTGDTVQIVDITPESDGYGDPTALEWKTTSGKLSRYICPHFLGLSPLLGFPLRPGTTYAAILTNSIAPCGEKDDNGRCTGGEDFARGADFDAMLSGSMPGSADLRHAWEAYQPLRDWIADTNQNAGAILNAAVFTTQEPEAIVPKLREQIQDELPPEVSELTECTSPNTVSPCQVGERGHCSAASNDFTEVHGRISLPIFQTGTPPYLNPEDGGGFELDADGTPQVQRHEDVCFAMSIPAAPAPAGGYPVLVYAHGTGGSFAGEMDSGGFAQSLATAGTPAVLVAIDLPQHGERRGETDDEPEGLFYNFLNPRAARDNVLQGSADLMSVIRWVKQGGVMVAGSPVAFDTAHIALMGHSQGSTHSALIAAYEPDITGVVLSGNGGHLTSSMLSKTSPVDIASVVPIGLLDPDDNFKLAGGRFNPALAIIQSVFDAADPINYGRRIRRDPISASTPGVNLFMTYGLNDTYAPETTQQAYVIAAGLPVVQPVLHDFMIDRVGLTQTTAPVSNNVGINGTPRTVAMRQYQPRGDSDGHFVGVRSDQDGRPDVDRFLELLLAGDTPVVGQ